MLPETVVQFSGDALALVFLRNYQLAREGLLPRAYQLQLRHPADPYKPHHTHHTDECDGHKPPSAIKRRHNCDPEALPFRVRHAIAVGAHHSEYIRTERDVRVVSLATQTGIGPVCIQAVQFVLESIALRVNKAQSRVSD